MPPTVLIWSLPLTALFATSLFLLFAIYQHEGKDKERSTLLRGAKIGAVVSLVSVIAALSYTGYQRVTQHNLVAHSAKVIYGVELSLFGQDKAADGTLISCSYTNDGDRILAMNCTTPDGEPYVITRPPVSGEQ